eukprot:GHVT01098100.1.p1 GENE.GHVT01098100.1~~GHVT01098100.1.p1  ORF type:complete len:277 (+),score=50.73 GHVT01098100.1:2306-3136(+)
MLFFTLFLILFLFRSSSSSPSNSQAASSPSCRPLPDGQAFRSGPQPCPALPSNEERGPQDSPTKARHCSPSNATSTRPLADGRPQARKISAGKNDKYKLVSKWFFSASDKRTHTPGNLSELRRQAGPSSSPFNRALVFQEWGEIVLEGGQRVEWILEKDKSKCVVSGRFFDVCTWGWLSTRQGPERGRGRGKRRRLVGEEDDDEEEGQEEEEEARRPRHRGVKKTAPRPAAQRRRPANVKRTHTRTKVGPTRRRRRAGRKGQEEERRRKVGLDQIN